jgi:hypothetical protein
MIGALGIESAAEAGLRLAGATTAGRQRNQEGGGSWGNHGFPHVEMGKGKMPKLPPQVVQPRR